MVQLWPNLPAPGDTSSTIIKKEKIRNSPVNVKETERNNTFTQTTNKFYYFFIKKTPWKKNIYSNLKKFKKL